MNNSEYNELREASWRRQLTSAEERRVQDYLAAHPEAQAAWEDDLALTRQLQGLPDATLSSNFTSLVLRAIDSPRLHQERVIPSAAGGSGWLKRFVPRMAMAALALALGLGGFSRYQQHTRRQVARDVKEFFQVANLPGSVSGPEVFEDFEAIQKLQSVSFSTDDDLLAALR